MRPIRFNRSARLPPPPVSQPFREEKATLKSRTAAVLKHWRVFLPCALACFVLVNVVIELRPGIGNGTKSSDPTRRRLLDADSLFQTAMDVLEQASAAKTEKAAALRKAFTAFDDFLALQANAPKSKGRTAPIAEMRKVAADYSWQSAISPDARGPNAAGASKSSVDRFKAALSSIGAASSERDFATDASRQFTNLIGLTEELRAMDAREKSALFEFERARTAFRRSLDHPSDAIQVIVWKSLQTTLTVALWALTFLTAAAIIYGTLAASRKRSVGRSVAHFVDIARAITRGQARPRISPEALGDLRDIAEAFNNMIDARQEAEGRLQAAHQSLEFKVSARTAELWKANKALGEENERRLRAERDQQQAQKMEALGKLAGSIAHDFNNILTVIIGGAEYVRTKVGAHSELASMLKTIEKAGERAAGLTRQMLTFSRNEVLALEAVNLNEASNEAGEMLNRLLGVNIDFRMELSDDLRLVKANSNQIQQVIVNLAVNARDAMEGNGILTITTANAKVSPEVALRHGVTFREDWVEIAVRDTGCGMDAATIARIFEPFFTTKPKGKGTGFGLATVFGVVKQIGGFIEVESAVGDGSVFRVFFPAVDSNADASASGGASESEALSLGGNETLLLVDDEEDIRELAGIILESSGYRILSAPNAEEAIVLAEKHAGEIKGLITDVVMPGMSGVQLATILTRVIPGLNVLFVSGHSNESLTEEVLCATRGEYLQKPYLGEALAVKVRELLARRNVIPVAFNPLNESSARVTHEVTVA